MWDPRPFGLPIILTVAHIVNSILNLALGLKKMEAQAIVLHAIGVHLDLQDGQNNGPYTAYTLYVGILVHYLGLFSGGPGRQR